MENLKSYDITKFKKGDIITRVKATQKVYYDRSYIGNKFIFKGIANGCIYVYRDSTNYEHENKTIKLPLDNWSDGWDYYKDLDGKLSINESFESYIYALVKSEDYETLNELKLIFNKIL